MRTIAAAVGRAVEEVVAFSGQSGTRKTETFFDKLTAIEARNFDGDMTLTVAWWEGHEQEIDIGAEVIGLTPAECESGDYVLVFNGQEAPLKLGESGECFGALVAYPAYDVDQFFRHGMHFPADGPHPTDAYLHSGAVPEFFPGALYFLGVPALDPLLRPIVVELVENDETILDRTRTLLYLKRHPVTGDVILQPMTASMATAGAFAQLSPRGLERLTEQYFLKYVEALTNCDHLPPAAAAACVAASTAKHCVRTPPGPGDFTVDVNLLHTYFDPDFPDEALSVGGVDDLELSFGDGVIAADFHYKEIRGHLAGHIDPDAVTISYNKGGVCTRRPDPVSVGAVRDTKAPLDDWFVCDDLSFAAVQAELDNPIHFSMGANGEHLRFTRATEVGITIDEPTADVSRSGTCAAGWLSGYAEKAVLAWTSTIETLIADEWELSPGQDEALHRLMSPFELGVEREDTPAPDAPPFDVHPLPDYALSAQIGASPLEAFGMTADARDGWYIPYLVWPSPHDAAPFPDFWFCPRAPGQSCTTSPRSTTARSLLRSTSRTKPSTWRSA